MQALALADAAIRVSDHPEGYAARARALRALGDADAALAALDALVARSPGTALAHDALGVLLGEAGRLAEARAAFAAALRLDPRLARAHFGLAMLGEVKTPQRAALAALAADPAGLDEPARLFLLYALAKAYDDAGDVARAFAAAEAGASLRRRRWSGDEAFELARLRRAGPPGGASRGGATEAPIFVFGMARSGTTLVEQMLAAHADAFALGETESFADVGASAPDPAGAYFAALPTSARGKRVIDKSLGNVFHIAAIRRAFPRAKLVHVWRDPLDVGLSCHFTMFAAQTPFAPDLAGIGRYCRAHAALMASWREALPEQDWHEVGYERLIAEPEQEARALLAFCGLDWDARCLGFAANPGPVRTASLAQVREPIYARSVGRWRRYAAYLDPLREALGLS